MKPLPGPTLLLPILLAPAALGQADLLRCAALTDDTNRLRCYDNLAAELRAALADEVSVPAPSAPPAGAPAPATQDDDSAAPRALAIFGFESRPEEQRDITEILDRVESTVTSASHSRFSGWTLTLENGQVWQQIGSNRFDIAVGDTAVITRGSLNSFLLQREGTGRRVRVSRVE